MQNVDFFLKFSDSLLLILSILLFPLKNYFNFQILVSLWTSLVLSIFSISSVLAWQPSQVADPLLRSLRGGVGTPLCIDKQEVGTFIYSLLYTHTGPLGWLLHEVLQLLMWWRSWWLLVPAKDASYAALSSFPPPTLGLRHRLQPTAGICHSTKWRA